ncbi:NapC/NirT family cytochrome c [Terasakiella sp. SH-1]|uniref:NapC/NirT family cytochrome c n=1 Tax=Terasakiella sp. SH-1 TaxID=2560057 RepID=UPI0010730D0C|nr:NapC/NirT family cytochrome c [Terasakiella sp. SH-1]
MIKIWNWFWTKSNRYTFACALFVIGVVCWGGFHMALDYTNQTEFCISCHEMKDNVYEEYKRTVHYQNPSGVRAGCADCHVPKDWGAKLVRKIKATGELYGAMIGKIDTKEKFNAHRMDMARKVWNQMRENGSQECKNCHSYEAMHLDKQGENAQKFMRPAAQKGEACIDCHKGVAHRLPNLFKTYDQWEEEFEAVKAMGDDAQITKAKETYVANLWEVDCGLCHALYDPKDYSADDWTGHMKVMERYTSLNEKQFGLVLEYLHK